MGEKFGQGLQDLENRLVKLEMGNISAGIDGGLVKQGHGLKVEIQTFDGTKKFSSFRLQFETMANRCKWSLEEKATALYGAPEGDAVDVLYGLPANESKSYEAIMNVLERSFDGFSKAYMYELELQN